MVLKCLIIKVFEIANITISTQTAKEKRLISTKKFVSVPKCAYICILSIYNCNYENNKSQHSRHDKRRA